MAYKIEWRFATKYLNGRKETVLQGRYSFEPWGNWFFRVSTEKKPHWIWMEEFKVWRCNISI